ACDDPTTAYIARCIALSGPRVAPLEGAGVAVAKREAGTPGQVPLASVDVRPAVDDRHGQGAAVDRVSEGDQGSARQAPMRDANQVLGHRDTTRRPFAVEVRAVPRHVAVPAPRIERHGAGAGLRLGKPNWSQGWLGSLGWLVQGRTLIEVSARAGAGIGWRNRHHRPADKRRNLHPFE